MTAIAKFAILATGLALLASGCAYFAPPGPSLAQIDRHEKEQQAEADHPPSDLWNLVPIGLWPVGWSPKL
jgi:hypothetical protein